MRLEHIGIAIQNDDKASGLFARLFGKNAYKSEAVNSEKVNTTFFGLDNTKVITCTPSRFALYRSW